MASPVAKKLRADNNDDRVMSSPSSSSSSTTKPHESAVLYSYWRSSCSWRVRLALEWKCVPYTVKPVHLLQSGGEHFLEQYTKLNPNQVRPLRCDTAHTVGRVVSPC